MFVVYFLHSDSLSLAWSASGALCSGRSGKIHSSDVSKVSFWCFQQQHTPATFTPQCEDVLVLAAVGKDGRETRQVLT